MPFVFERIDCQYPPEPSFVRRSFSVVRAFPSKAGKSRLLAEAARLAGLVSPRLANMDSMRRNGRLLFLDSLAGVLSRSAWTCYINRVYGAGAALLEHPGGAEKRFDIVLNGKWTIRIKSSFPRNGVKFALCHALHNFRAIHAYSSARRPLEAEADFSAAALFSTPKKSLDSADDAALYLVGGATRAMMSDERIAFCDNLAAGENRLEGKTKYKVVRLADSLDMAGFNEYMKGLGYAPVFTPRYGEAF